MRIVFYYMLVFSFGVNNIETRLIAHKIPQLNHPAVHSPLPPKIIPTINGAIGFGIVVAPEQKLVPATN